MADRYWAPDLSLDNLWSYDSGGGGADSNWCSEAARTTRVAKPTTSDTVYFDNHASCENCTADDAVSQAGILGLTMTDYANTLTIDSATTDIDVNGPTIVDSIIALGAAGGDLYCSGNFTKTLNMTALPAGLNVYLDGTGDVACNSVSGGALIINTAGTHTATDAQLWSSYLSTTGIYAAGAYAHTIVGDIVRDNGTCNTTGVWTQTGTGNLKWTSTGTNQYPSELVINGTGTLTDTVVLKKLSGNGTLADSAQAFYFRLPADNFWNFTGTASCPFSLYTTTSGLSTGLDIVLQGKNVTITGAGGANPMILDGVLDLKGAAGTAGDFLLDGSAVLIKFDAASYSITANNITIGHATRAVTLDLGTGSHTVTGTISRGAGSPVINYGSATITLIGGTLNGASMGTPLCDAAAGLHPKVINGTVSNVAMPVTLPALDATGGSVNGGGNTNTWFSGTNGGHQILGGGFIGSARAA